MTQLTVLRLSAVVTICLSPLIGCFPSSAQDSSENATTAEPTADSVPEPTAGFVPHTLRQEELRGLAMQAVQSGQNNLGIAALITLSETPERSALRGSAMLMLSELYVEEQEAPSISRALTVLAALDAEYPPIAEFKFVYGRTLAESGRYGEAEPLLRAAIELRQDLLQTYMYLGSPFIKSPKDRL